MNVEEFKAALARHDWTYYMSDDHRVFVRGEAAQSKIMSQAKAGGDEFKRAFNEAHAKVFHREPWAKPWNFPFEVAP